MTNLQRWKLALRIWHSLIGNGADLNRDFVWVIKEQIDQCVSDAGPASC